MKFKRRESSVGVNLMVRRIQFCRGRLGGVIVKLSMQQMRGTDDCYSNSLALERGTCGLKRTGDTEDRIRICADKRRRNLGDLQPERIFSAKIVRICNLGQVWQ